MQVIKNTLQHTQCPFCQHKETVSVARINYPSQLHFSTTLIKLENEAHLHKCRQCNSAFVQYAIPEETAISLYTNSSSNKRWKSHSFRQEKTPEMINALQRVFQAGSHVLDIGCNTGELLDFAKENGCITHGNELSEESQRVLLAKGHKVCPQLNNIADDSMDVITAFDLIEHLYDVPGFLKLCKSKLKKNGRMVILTGDIQSVSARWSGSNWWYLQYPEHVSFPSPAFLETSGLFMEQLMATYASVGYKRSLPVKVGKLILRKLSGNYKGLPSWGPDHYLAILKKSK